MTNGFVIPPGECKQCYYHAYVLHRGNSLGFKKEPECQPCLSHMYGCPENMIQQ